MWIFRSLCIISFIYNISYVVSSLQNDTYENLSELYNFKELLSNVLNIKLDNITVTNVRIVEQNCDRKFIEYHLNVTNKTDFKCLVKDSNASSSFNGKIIIQKFNKSLWLEPIDIVSYMLNYTLSEKKYAKVLFISSYNFYTFNYTSLKCGLFYTCNFEFQLILLNQTCITDRVCISNQLNVFIQNFNGFNSNITSSTKNSSNPFSEFLKSDSFYKWLILVVGPSEVIPTIYNEIENNLFNFIHSGLIDVLLIDENSNEICQRTFNNIGGKEVFKYKSTSSIRLIPVLDYIESKSALNFTYNCSNIETRNKSNEIEEAFSIQDYSLTSSLAFKENTIVVLAVQNEPFIFKNPKKPGGWDGFCVDLLNEISKTLELNILIKEMNEEGEIFQAYLNIETNETIYKWSGAMGELLDGQADLIAGKVVINSLKNYFIEYSPAYFTQDSVVLLTRKSNEQSDLFLFVNVFSWQLWLCLFAYIFLNGFIMFVLDRTRPLTSEEEENKIKVTHQYNLLDSIWFIMGAFTLAGGVHPPKALPVKILLASFWFFSAITITTYQANIAAFLTVSNLNTKITSVKDLPNQVEIQYTVVQNSDTYKLFYKLKSLEDNFLKLWKHISLGDDYASFNTYYKSLLKSFAIWDYPLTDVFTRLWLGVNKAGIFQTSQEALTKVLNTDKFGLLTDYSYAKYVQSRTCSNYDILGEGVAERSYGFGYKNNFKYRDKFSQLIMDMKKNQVLHRLKQNWWRSCPNNNEEFNAITLNSIGGSFIFLLVGIILAIPFQGFLVVLKQKMKEKNSAKI